MKIEKIQYRERRFYLLFFCLILIILQIADETNYMRTSKIDHEKQLHELRIRMEENFSNESNNQKVFEEEMQSSLTSILIADDNRRAAFQLAYEEEQQNIAVRILTLFTFHTCCHPFD